MASRVLFIGGTRFFGKRIVGHLAAHGHHVTVLTRGQKPAPDANANIAHINCDRTDGAALARALGGRDFDAVIDNICYRPADAERAGKIFRDRCERYILTSSVMSYLNISLHNRAIGERHWAAARSTDGLEIQYGAGELEYARNKRAAEQALLNAGGFKTIILRLQNVVGEDDFSGKSGLLAQRLRANAGRLTMVGGEGDLYQQVYAGDMGDIYRLAVELPAAGLAEAYNVAAPPIAVAEYVAILGAALGTGGRLELTEKAGHGVLDHGHPYPKNVVLDCARLRRDFAVSFTGYKDFLPHIAHFYDARARP